MRFERALIPIQDEKTFGDVAGALDQVFAPANVGRFLRQVQSAGLRVRDFEGVLTRGLLGPTVPARYGALGDSDRGQVREQYLSRLEQVAPELRAKFLKVYAYY